MIFLGLKPRQLLPLLLLCSWRLGSAQPAGLTSSRLTVKSYMDFGHMVNGYNQYGDAATDSKNIAMLPLNRANVIAIQDVGMDRFDVSVGLSALVWWPYDGGISSDLKQRLINVKPLVPVAKARWKFGNPGSTSGSLQVGTFNYKYNPDAKNLGEYLYRSGTYPGFLWSNEGWLLMNRAGNFSHGLLASFEHMDGRLKHNLSLFMETQFFPIGDFSPGYDFSFSSKWAELGGGAVFNHYLPIRPSKLQPNSDQNTYVQVKDLVPNAGGGTDTLVYYAPKFEIPNLFLQDAQPPVEMHRWTSKGVKLMGRMAFNLGHLLPEESRGPEDARIFFETALLGLEDQPLFYEKKSERMPFMLGVNLPTWKLLDLLSMQVEYYSSPFNDISNFNNQSFPIWKVAYAKDSADKYLTTSGGSLIPVANHKDDWKWSVYAKKNLNKLITVYAQTASDHFRLTDADFRSSPVPLATKPGEWYYLLRLEFALR